MAMFTGPSTAPAASKAESKGRLVQRIPWLWRDVLARTRLPLWLLSLLVFFIGYSGCLLLALIAGELPQLVRDARWLILFGLPAFAALTLGYTPHAMARLWTNMRPWLANSEQEIANFQTITLRMLTPFFWLAAALLGGFVLFWAFVDPQQTWHGEFAHPEILRLIPVLAAPFYAYFGGGAVSIAGVGLGLWAYRIGHGLEFKPGFILQGSKTALQPFNQLLWIVWGTITLPVILTLVFLTAVDAEKWSPRAFQVVSPAILIVQWAVPLAIVVLTIVVPQLFMNRLLVAKKALELQRLRLELDEAAKPPATHDAFDVLQRIQRHQHLVHQYHDLRSFTPTLVGTRFVIQIAISVIGIVLPRVLQRLAG